MCSKALFRATGLFGMYNMTVNCCTQSEPGILLHFHASFAMFLHASTGVFTKTRYIPGVSRHDLTSALRLASV